MPKYLFHKPNTFHQTGAAPDLARKLMRYIRHYNRAPKPIKWTYRDPSHRITR